MVWDPFDQVSFDGRAPDLKRIADKVTALCGLAVIVDESAADVLGNLYYQHDHIAFASAAQEQLEIFSYRPGTVRQFYDEFTQGVELPTERFVTGLNEPAGTQTIYLRGFVENPSVSAHEMITHGQEDRQAANQTGTLTLNGRAGRLHIRESAKRGALRQIGPALTRGGVVLARGHLRAEGTRTCSGGSTTPAVLGFGVVH